MPKLVVRTFATAIAVSLCASMATAAPLYNISVLASSSQTGPYTSSLEVQPGHTYFYEIVGKLNPIGTVNTHTNGTINSVSAADGAIAFGHHAGIWVELDPRHVQHELAGLDVDQPRGCRRLERRLGLQRRHDYLGRRRHGQ